MSTPRDRLETAVGSERLRTRHVDDLAEMMEPLESRVEELREQIEALEEAQQEGEAAVDAVTQWADEEDDPEARADYREEALEAIQTFLDALDNAEPGDREPEPEKVPDPPVADPELLEQVDRSICDLPNPQNHELTSWYVAQGDLPNRLRDCTPDQLRRVATQVVAIRQASAVEQVNA